MRTKNTTLLDDEFYSDIQQYLAENEQIIWKGQPRYTNNLTWLELGGYHDVMSGGASIFGFILGGIGVGTFYFYNINNIMGIVLTWMIGIIFMVLPDIIKNQRRKQTKYLVTENRIIFQLWYWGKKSIGVLPFSNIKNAILSKNENGVGTIYLVPKNINKIDFVTYDFKAGDQRHVPTLEVIENAKEVYQKIKNNIGIKYH